MAGLETLYASTRQDNAELMRRVCSANYELQAGNADGARQIRNAACSNCDGDDSNEQKIDESCFHVLNPCLVVELITENN